MEPNRLSGRINRGGGHTPANLPILGKIKTGEKREKTNQNGRTVEYPVSLDYFRCTGDYDSLFHKVYGDKPNKITVVFHSDDISQVANERLELRDKAGRLVAASDGMVVKYFDANSDTYQYGSTLTEPDIMQRLERQSTSIKGWEAVLTLRFLMPDIPSVLGVWELSTKGEASSIPAIIGTLQTVFQMGGTIAGVPMDLSVEKVSSQKPGSKSNYPVIRIIPNLSQKNLETLRNLVENGLAGIKRLSVYTPERLEQLVEGGSGLALPEHTAEVVHEAPAEQEATKQTEATAKPTAKEKSEPATATKPTATKTTATTATKPKTLKQEHYDAIVDIYHDLPLDWVIRLEDQAREGKLEDDAYAGAMLQLYRMCVQACRMLTNGVEHGWIEPDAADDIHRGVISLKATRKSINEVIKMLAELEAEAGKVVETEETEIDTQETTKALEGEVTV